MPVSIWTIIIKNGGGVGGNIGYDTHFYTHQHGKGSLYVNLNTYGHYKRLSWNLYGNYRPFSYGVNNKRKHYGSESELTVTWRVNKHLGITGNMRYLLGTLGYDSTTHEGTYYNFSSGRMKDRSFCFSLGFNYYMQGKNFKYRNKKSLQSTEQGIKLWNNFCLICCRHGMRMILESRKRLRRAHEECAKLESVIWCHSTGYRASWRRNKSPLIELQRVWPERIVSIRIRVSVSDSSETSLSARVRVARISPW